MSHHQKQCMELFGDIFYYVKLEVRKRSRKRFVYLHERFECMCILNTFSHLTSALAFMMLDAFPQET